MQGTVKDKGGGEKKKKHQKQVSSEKSVITTSGWSVVESYVYIFWVENY